MKELNDLAELIKQGEVEKSLATVKTIIDEGAIEKILSVMTIAMRELGEQFEKKKIQKKTVVLGTVEGDIHEIGKNIVSIVLKAEGYNVIDLGTDVGIDKFLLTASEKNASIIGLSTLLTTTMHIQMDLISKLIEEGESENYFVIIGGAPVSQKWADRIGADAYCEDAFSAAQLLNSLQ